MKYSKIARAEFLDRKNRFVAICNVEGEEVKAHVPNTGRCEEILIPGTTVYLQKADESAARATKWTLIVAEKQGKVFNLDSHAPNKVLWESLENKEFVLPGIGETIDIKAEVTFGESRLDFCVDGVKGRAYVEVKGVTLEKDGVALFPDAPTIRGIKHLNTLMSAVDKGYTAVAVFVLQFSGAEKFTPNSTTHKEFADALKRAAEYGVKVIAFECTIKPDEIKYNKFITVEI